MDTRRRGCVLRSALRRQLLPLEGSLSFQDTLLNVNYFCCKYARILRRLLNPFLLDKIRNEAIEKVTWWKGEPSFDILNNSSATAIINRDDADCLTSLVALGCFMNKPVGFIEELSNEWSRSLQCTVTETYSDQGKGCKYWTSHLRAACQCHHPHFPV